MLDLSNAALSSIFYDMNPDGPFACPKCGSVDLRVAMFTRLKCGECGHRAHRTRFKIKHQTPKEADRDGD